MKRVLSLCLAAMLGLSGCGLSTATNRTATNSKPAEEVELYFIQQTDDDGNEFFYYDIDKMTYIMNGSIEDVRKKGGIIISADEVKSAEPKYDNNTGPTVIIQLNDAGTKLFAEATERAFGNQRESIGIYYNGEFISVPQVNDPIKDGNVVISGMVNFSEAVELAEKLNGR